MPHKMNSRDLGIYIGVIVKRQRELRALSQSDLALKAGVTQAEISYVERGKRSQLKTLDRIAQAMDVRFSELVRFAEDIGDTKSVIHDARKFVDSARKALVTKRHKPAKSTVRTAKAG